MNSQQFWFYLNEHLQVETSSKCHLAVSLIFAYSFMTSLLESICFLHQLHNLIYSCISIFSYKIRQSKRIQNNEVHL
jgi:hypothetical protein